jgi:hypothetical protein
MVWRTETRKQGTETWVTNGVEGDIFVGESWDNNLKQSKKLAMDNLKKAEVIAKSLNNK